jgi:diketogulonate reductase-like aldo/keto reductase
MHETGDRTQRPHRRGACPSRRDVLRTAAALLPLAVPHRPAPAAATTPAAVLTRTVRSSGEALPLVGLGSWITFNVGSDAAARADCAEVMRAFFAAGGRLIDSSPMYGSSQSVIGEGLQRLGRSGDVFSADKVWTGSAAEGPSQIEASRRHWRVARFDLLQVHNLVGWQAHLPRLFEMKAAGRLRHVGITTSDGRRHAELESLMRSQPLDFVQFSYNLLDREAEARLLPLAQDRGIAVLVNRPFRRGALVDALQRHPLPGWASELGCDGWAQVALKFIVSHPAVTCAIPATTRPAHARQNLGAAHGPLPDAALRRRIVADVTAL